MFTSALKWRGIVHGELRFEFGHSEDVKSSALLGSMASQAAFIKGIDVAGLDAKGVLGALLTFYWGGAMVGRFVGSALMQGIKPSSLLAGAGLLAVLLIGMSISMEGVSALLMMLAVGFCNSIMFPTIFTLAIEDLGEAKPQGSGILCTAIAGGAFIPPWEASLTPPDLRLLLSCRCCAICTPPGMQAAWCLTRADDRVASDSRLADS